MASRKRTWNERGRAVIRKLSGGGGGGGCCGRPSGADGQVRRTDGPGRGQAELPLRRRAAAAVADARLAGTRGRRVHRRPRQVISISTRPSPTKRSFRSRFSTRSVFFWFRHQ